MPGAHDFFGKTLRGLGKKKLTKVCKSMGHPGAYSLPSNKKKIPLKKESNIKKVILRKTITGRKFSSSASDNGGGNKERSKG